MPTSCLVKHIKKKKQTTKDNLAKKQVKKTHLHDWIQLSEGLLIISTGASLNCVDVKPLEILFLQFNTDGQGRVHQFCPYRFPLPAT